MESGSSEFEFFAPSNTIAFESVDLFFPEKLMKESYVKLNQCCFLMLRKRADFVKVVFRVLFAAGSTDNYVRRGKRSTSELARNQKYITGLPFFPPHSGILIAILPLYILTTSQVAAIFGPDKIGTL